MDIQPIHRATVSEQVFSQLKQKIIEGQWVQGEKLPSENDLAEGFQVSRVTIRHAIHKLVALGLAETRTGEGTFIRALTPGALMQGMIPAAFLTPRDTLEVLDFRYVLEVETAGLAARRHKDGDVASLETQLGVMLEARSDPWAFSQADLDFHMLIARITRNSLIIETYHILRDILEVCMKETVDSLGVEIGIPFHKLLITAIRERDADDARRIMREHMDATRQEFVQALKARET